MSMTLNESILRLHPTNVFVETGTFNGDGVAVALKTGIFKKIYSIEIFEGRADFARDRFSNHKNVSIFAGKSKDVLPVLLPQIYEPVTLWLDAHSDLLENPQPDTAPILDELEILSKQEIKNNVILIDDMRLCGTGNWKDITVDRVVKAIKGINSGYEIEFVNSNYFPLDVLVAYVVEGL